MNSKKKQDESKSNKHYLMVGIFFSLGGAGLVVLCYLQFRAMGEIHFLLVAFAAVLLVMGFGSVIRGIFGDKIEWD